MLEQVGADLKTMLQREPGMRIGLVVSDAAMLVYSPTPLLIEGGPTPRLEQSERTMKPNAVLLSHTPPEIGDDLGHGADGVRAQTVGLDKATRTQIGEVKKDLEVNPPQRFDVSRAVRIFNSRIQYVEFKFAGYQLSKKEVSIPASLLGLADNRELVERWKNGFLVFGEKAGFQWEHWHGACTS